MAQTQKKTITIEQIGSREGQTDRQCATLTGLGLTKRHRRRTLKNTPDVQGMIRKVQHLVRVVEE